MIGPKTPRISDEHFPRHFVRKTKWPGLGYEKVADGLWRFVAIDPIAGNAHVGPQYPTREALLQDMRRYAEENWGLT